MRRLLALALAGLLFAGCGTTNATTAVKNWATSSNVVANSATLLLDARHAATTLRVTSSSSVTLHTVCGVLLLQIQQANSSLPTPDAQLTTLLSQTYTSWGQAANECYAAGASRARRQRAVASLTQGAATLSEALARLASIS